MRVLVIVGTDEDTLSIASSVIELYPDIGLSGVWGDANNVPTGEDFQRAIIAATREFTRKMEAKSNE